MSTSLILELLSNKYTRVRSSLKRIFDKARVRFLCYAKLEREREEREERERERREGERERVFCIDLE